MQKSIIYAIAILMLSSACQKAPEQFANSDKYRLVWNDDPSTTITVAWDQLDGTTGEVLYSTEDHGRKFWKYEHSTAAQAEMNRYDMQTRFAKLTGLQPGTNYYFVLRDEQGVSERYWFRTAPDKPEPFTFVVGGDTKSEGETLEAGRATNRIVSKLRPLFVLYNGDFITGDGTNAEWWHQWLIDWHTQVTTSDGRMIPLVPVMGNHENGNKRNLNIVFNAPYQNNDTTQVYYSMNFGGDLLHLIALNSEIPINTFQKDWLEKDLKANASSALKVAGYHKPFFPHTDRKRENHHIYDAWAHLFHDHGLTLSIDADSHMHKITYPLRPDSTEAAIMRFVRDDETGTVFIGEGSWGAWPRDNNDDKPWTLTSGSFNQVKWIHVIPEREDQEAHFDIYTIISCEYDENEKQYLYDEGVEALTEENLFKVPENAKLHPVPGIGNSVKVPFHLNN